MFSIYMKTTLKIFFGRNAEAACFSIKNLKAHAETDMEGWHYQQWGALGSSAMGGDKLGRAAIRNVLEEENIF